jgi:hypothetical protein
MLRQFFPPTRARRAVLGLCGAPAASSSSIQGPGPGGGRRGAIFRFGLADWLWTRHRFSLIFGYKEILR